MLPKALKVRFLAAFLATSSGVVILFVEASYGDTIRHVTGKCLDVASEDGGQNGSRIQLWDCNGAPAQQFTLTAEGAIRHVGGKCLDVASEGGGQNGSRIQLWDCNGAPAQQLAINPLSQPVPSPQIDRGNGYVSIQLPNTGSQDDKWSCGSNSAARVLAFYGHGVNYSQVRAVAERDHGIIPPKVCLGSGILKTCATFGSFKTGLEPNEVRAVMKRWEGGNVKLETGTDLGKLKNLLNEGKPVLVLLRVGSFKPGEIFGTWPEMHWVVADGFNDQQQLIYYTDTDGGRYHLPYSDFLGKWDWRIGKGLASEIFHQKGVRAKTMVWVDRRN